MGGLVLALACASSVALVGADAAHGFPIVDGSRANEVLGQADFTTGYVPFDQDPFFGAQPTSERRFFVTSDLAYDESGERLFVADIHNHRILVFDLWGGIGEDPQASFVLGQPDFTTGGADPENPYGNVNTANPSYGCGEGVNACGLHRVWAVSYDPVNDRLFAADPDNHRILVWDLLFGLTDGMPATYVLGQSSFTTREQNAPCGGGAGGPVNECGMKRPGDVHYDVSTERLYVADSGNHRVLVFDLSLGLVSGMAASAVLGQPGFTTGEPNTGCGGASGVDACSLSEPTAIAVDPSSGRLFLGDQGTSRVLVFDVSTGITSGMSATGVLGQPDFATATVNTSCAGGGSGDENTNPCGFGIFGVGLAYDVNDDRLFVSDASNHRVLVFDVAAVSAGEPALGVLGQPDLFSGYDAADPALGGATTRARAVSTSGIRFDPLGDRLFVADGGNHRVLVFGANINGTPVVLEGSVAGSSTTENEDGSTTVEVAGNNGDRFSVTLPPGTEPLDGADEIVITIDNTAALDEPKIQVDAKLPPGETKSITMPAGKGYHICIYDHADDATFEASSLCDVEGADRFVLPPKGKCFTYETSGDLGDNPDDPNDSDGMHPVVTCMSADAATITMDGLRHTILQTVRRDTFEPEAPIVGDDDGRLPAAAATGGCGVGGGAGGGPALLLLALLARRRYGMR